MTPVELVLSRLPRARRSGDGWRSPCPAHAGTRPDGLKVREGDDGNALLHCFVGCSKSEIVAALGLEMCDLFGRGDGWGQVIARKPKSQPLPRTVLQQHGKPIPPDAELAEQEHGQVLAWTGRRWEKVTGDRRRPEYNTTSFPGSRRHAEYLAWVESQRHPYSDEARGYPAPLPYCRTCDSEQCFCGGAAS